MKPQPLNGCHNRPPLKDMVEWKGKPFPFTMSRDCQYSKTTDDHRCAGCVHHARPKVGIEIGPEDILIETFINQRGNGVRITHLPTRVKTECADFKSQHQNKFVAMGMMRALLASLQPTKEK